MIELCMHTSFINLQGCNAYEGHVTHFTLAAELRWEVGSWHRGVISAKPVTGELPTQRSCSLGWYKPINATEKSSMPDQVCEYNCLRVSSPNVVIMLVLYWSGFRISIMWQLVGLPSHKGIFHITTMRAAVGCVTWSTLHMHLGR